MLYYKTMRNSKRSIKVKINKRSKKLKVSRKSKGLKKSKMRKSKMRKSKMNKLNYKKITNKRRNQLGGEGYWEYQQTPEDKSRDEMMITVWPARHEPYGRPGRPGREAGDDRYYIFDMENTTIEEFINESLEHYNNSIMGGKFEPKDLVVGERKLVDLLNELSENNMNMSLSALKNKVGTTGLSPFYNTAFKKAAYSFSRIHRA
jgi:hypothetical protein